MKIFLIIAGAFVFLLFIGSLPKRGDRGLKKNKRLTNEAKAYIAAIQDAQSLPVIEVLNFQLQQNEFVILHQASVSLHAFVPPPIAHADVVLKAAGYMLVNARKPGREPDQPPHIATGDFSLTNQRLAFTSDRMTLVIALDRIVSFYATNLALRVNTMDSQTPYFWMVANPAIWAIMLQWMSTTRLTDPKLSTGTRLTLNAQGSGNRKANLTLGFA
ncbi:MAG: hypothetical protein ACREP6_13390 [Candidatus Binataceae bacterium]